MTAFFFFFCLSWEKLKKKRGLLDAQDILVYPNSHAVHDILNKGLLNLCTFLHPPCCVGETIDPFM